MENKILTDIINYINFLKTTGYSVSLSCFKDNFEPFTTELLNYQIHTHTVCSYLKAYPSTKGSCVLNKRKLEQSNITEPYYSCCFAGVEEYVFPVKAGDRTIACVNISGFRGRLSKSLERMERISKICDERFSELYMELEEEIPDFRVVKSFVTPLEYMLCELYQYCASAHIKDRVPSAAKEIYLRAIEYIHDNISGNITAESLAAELNYSPSYLRYIFNKESTYGVNETIRQIRLEGAKELLISTSLSVTEIAYNQGFCDSSYFCTVFKKKYNISPSRYRAEQKK